MQGKAKITTVLTKLLDELKKDENLSFNELKEVIKSSEELSTVAKAKTILLAEELQKQADQAKEYNNDERLQELAKSLKK